MIDSRWIWSVARTSYTMNVLRSHDHGMAHWARVAERGAWIGDDTKGADLTVIEFFALFHDSMRENEYDDPDHGARGFKLAVDLNVDHALSGRQMEILKEACLLHDKGLLSKEPTIGACWDADRLDLHRVGITPTNEFLSTAAGKKINDGRRAS